MAKLNGVKTLAETIVYGGVTYVKTDEAPKAGDIVRCEGDGYDANWGDCFLAIDVPDDGGDKPSIVDNVGDTISPFETYRDEWTVFRRQETSTTSVDIANRDAKVGETIRIVAKDDHRYENGDEFVVDAVDDDGSGDVRITVDGADDVLVVRRVYVVVVVTPKISSTTSADDIVTVDGVQYRKVTRKAAVGDLAVIIANTRPDKHRFGIGEVVRIKSIDGKNIRAEYRDGHGFWLVYSADIAVLERIETPAPATPTSLPSDYYVIHDGTVYRKESRKASDFRGTNAKGALVIVTSEDDDTRRKGLPLGKVLVNQYAGGIGYQVDGDGRAVVLYYENAALLTPATTVIIDGNEYDVVKRRANVGETVLITDGATHYINVGAIVTVRSATDDWATVTVKGGQYRDGRSGHGTQIVRERNYVVLTPKSTATPTTSTTTAGYREVRRKANVGERIRIVNPIMSAGQYDKGDEFTVKRLDRSGDVRIQTRNFDDFFVCHSEYVVLEPMERIESIETPKTPSTRLAVGDYAKVVQAGINRGIFQSHGFNVGQIVKVTAHATLYDDRVKAEPLDGKDAWYVHNDDVVRATDAEVAAAKRPNVKVGDTDATEDRRARAGDFKAGDIARIVSITSRAAAGFNVGDIVNVLNYESCGNYTLRIGKDDGRRGYVDACDLERVSTTETPVAAKTTSTERLKVGEYARVVVIGKDVPYGDIVRIDEDDETDIPFKGVKVNGGTDEWDWFTSDQLERIDAETAKWYAIGRQVGEYKVGDVVRYRKTRSSRIHGLIDYDDIITEIDSVDRDGDVHLKKPAFVTCGYDTYTYKDEITLVAPVETLFSA